MAHRTGLLPIVYFNFAQTANEKYKKPGKQQTADRRRQTADGRQQTVDSKQ